MIIILQTCYREIEKVWSGLKRGDKGRKLNNDRIVYCLISSNENTCCVALRFTVETLFTGREHTDLYT